MRNPDEEAKIAMMSSQVAIAVYANDYYVRAFEHLLNGRTLASMSYAEHVMLWHLFWEALPDSRSIRRTPFWDVCNIAEYVFDLTPEEAKLGERTAGKH